MDKRPFTQSCHLRLGQRRASPLTSLFKVLCSSKYFAFETMKSKLSYTFSKIPKEFIFTYLFCYGSNLKHSLKIQVLVVFYFFFPLDCEFYVSVPSSSLLFYFELRLFLVSVNDCLFKKKSGGLQVCNLCIHLRSNSL